MKKITIHLRTTLTIAILILAISAISMMETAVTASNANDGGADNLSPTVCVAKPPNLVSWYKGENNALDSADDNNSTIQGNVTFTTGEVGQTFTLGGNGDLAGNGDRVLVGNPANLQLQNFTIEAWIKRSSSTIVTNSPVAGFAGGTFFAYGLNGYGFFIDQPTNRLGLTQIGVPSVSSTATVSDTNFHHVAVTKSGNQVTFYVDGVADAPVTYNANFTFTTNAAIGARGDNDARNAFFGSEDELSIYNRALSLAEIQGIFNAGPAGKCDPPASTSFMVTNTNDSGAGSLRQAVMNSNISAGADTIEFDSSFNTARTITLASQIIIDANDDTALTITGPGANLLTVSGNNAVRIFNIAASETVTFSNMKLTQGNADNSAGSAGGFFGGAILTGTGTTNVTNLIIDNNKARFGGGIYNFGTLNITNSTISNNTAATTNSNGGGIRNAGATLTFTNATIVNNSTTASGGGIQVGATLRNSLIANNFASGTGNDLSGTYTSQGYNLIRSTTGATITGIGQTH